MAGWGVKADGIVGPQTGSWLLWGGDGYYNGGNNSYCYHYIPGDANSPAVSAAAPTAAQ